MDRRLERLFRIFPPEKCAQCLARPPIYCIEHEDDPVPDFEEGPCPVCGSMRYTVPIVVGVDCDKL
jgi:hypothetical protein